MTDSREAARARMTAPSRPGPIDRWLDAHPGAIAQVEDWLELLEARETDWGIRRLHGDLVAAHGYPFKDPSGLWRRLRARYAERFDRVFGGD